MDWCLHRILPCNIVLLKVLQITVFKRSITESTVAGRPPRRRGQGDSESDVWELPKA